MEHKIIQIGGMRRTGTNYLNFFFQLHPDILSFHTPDIRGMKLTNEITHEEFYNYWLHEYNKGSRWHLDNFDGDKSFENYVASKKNRDFKLVSFKHDFGEKFAPLVNFVRVPSLFLYCTRPLNETYRSEVRYFRRARDIESLLIDAQRFIAYVKSSINMANNIINQLGNLTFLPIKICGSNQERIRSLVEVMEEYTEVGLHEMQRKFLEDENKIEVSRVTLTKQEEGNIEKALLSVSNYQSVIQEYEQLTRRLP